ncbi:MAG: peptidoglycan recognition protein family protein [Burkholderiaceae bacterium]|jgi:hypothetical protein|nr:peptidoglycan recognition protein family protein [Burkholderiaceae bacterium]
MNDIRIDDLKISDFETVAGMVVKGVAAAVKTVQVEVNHRAATRQAIIVALRKKGFTFETRSDWKAKPGEVKADLDWDYRGIALHHAGNSFSCDANEADQLRQAERIDFKRFGHISYHYAIACDGTIYEALDIREKGAHIEDGNTGVIGIVMLADLSVRGEAYKEEYANKPWLEKIKKINEWALDKIDLTNQKPTDQMTKALFALVEVLLKFFPITMLGGHREFQKIANGEGRACPGYWGMMLVKRLRQNYKIEGPKK